MSLKIKRSIAAILFVAIIIMFYCSNSIAAYYSTYQHPFDCDSVVETSKFRTPDLTAKIEFKLIIL